MVKQRLNPVRHSITRRKEDRYSFLLLTLSFLFGSIAGSLIGSFQNFDSPLNDFVGLSKLQSADFMYLFLNFIRFHILALLLSTSFFGIVLLPMLSCVRGFALSCTAATIISSVQGNGLVMALLVLGIPAVLSLTCFFTISIDGFGNSKRILNLVRGNSASRVDGVYMRTLACIPVLAVGTIFEMKFVPYLVSNLK